MNGGITNNSAYILAKLMRLPNLIIVTITLYIIAHFGIHPPLIQHGITPALTNKEYYLFIFIIVCIGAGGYVYNDIVDQKTDITNDKRKIVGQAVTRNLAFILYLFLTITPLLCALSLAMEIERPELIFYYFVLVTIFFIYNRYLQKLVLLGNITVALLCALTVLIPWTLEFNAFRELAKANPIAYEFSISRLIAFSLFCFMANLIREIIKDMEDIEGDRESNYYTLPIAIGIEGSTTIVRSLSILLLTCIIIWSLACLDFQIIQHIIAVFSLVTSLTFIIYTTSLPLQNEDFSKLSQYWKLYLLLGIISYILIT